MKTVAWLGRAAPGGGSAGAAVAVALAIAVGACGTEERVASDLSSPEAAFQTVLAAARARDRAAFLDCFAEGSTRDSMRRALDENPDRFWGQLEGVLRPPQELTITRRGADEARGRVHAPGAEGEGVGGLTFERVGGRWKIKGW